MFPSTMYLDESDRAKIGIVMKHIGWDLPVGLFVSSLREQYNSIATIQELDRIIFYATTTPPSKLRKNPLSLEQILNK